MKLIALFRSLVSRLFQRSRTEREMDDELRAHLQLRADDLERTGISRREAERRARIEFGGYERFKEESHEELGGDLITTTLQDVRFGLRTLWKSPGFTVVAVITLALGIGANAIVFGVMNAVVLHPLNLPQVKSLYMIERAQGNEDSSPMQSYADYRDLRDRNRSFDGLATYNIMPAGLDTGDNPSQAWIYEASGNYFDVLGVQPYLGRFFHGSDEHGKNSVPYIVLSFGYWQSHFNGDPGVVGRTVQVNKNPFTILGVAQPEFRGSELYFSPAFWIPILNDQRIGGGNDLEDRTARSPWILGRLKSGITAEQATADLNSIAADLGKTYPKEDGKATLSLAPPGLAGTLLGRPVRGFVAGLMLLAGLILLAACANLGGLFAARAADRAKEIALRLALGSSRKRILRQLLTEAVLVSLAGGTVGLLGSVVLLRMLSAWQPVSDMPMNVPVNADATVYLVALLLAVASGLLFGIVPVRQVLDANPYQIVKSGLRGKVAGRFALRDLLLVVQIAICAVLVTSSLVAVRGMARSLSSNFGFQPQHAVVASTDLLMAGYKDEGVAAMQRRMIDTLGAIPGVTAVGLVDRLPLSMEWDDEAVFKGDVSDLSPSNQTTEAEIQDVSPGYLHAAGTALLSGREMTWHDDFHAPRVAIVNREFAYRLFGSEAKAVGGSFKLKDGSRIEVVGVVEDGKFKTITEDPLPAAFVPILQSPSSSTWLVIRSNGDPQELAAAVREAMRKLDPGLPMTIKPWNQHLDRALFASRTATVSLGVLGALGAMLAATGIFGMASYSVSKRLRELGIRIALGAQRKEVLGAALGRAFRLLVFGSLAGLLLGVAARKVLASIVYQATPRDPVVLCGVVAAMLLLGLVATWIPAQRALAADPLMLLREE
jgi:predicted permease